MNHLSRYTFGLIAVLFLGSTQAADWSTNEVQLQYGDIAKPFQGGKGSADTGSTTILTFQHASGWKYGDNFFFFDYLNYGQTDVDKARGDQGGTELYGEWYSNFSLGKITEKDLSFFIVKDIGLIAGFNFAPEVETFYYLPGVRLALDLPGFAFANLDLTAYIQDSPSETATGARIDEDNSFMVDFNWAYPFTLGSTQWSIEGHIEYIDGVDTKVKIPGVGTVNGERESWILAQPQVRLDLGNVLGMSDKQLFAGIEYQYWQNKLGDKQTDENIVQLLLVWRL